MTSFKQYYEEFQIVESFIQLSEMSNYSSDQTGVPYDIWIGRTGGQHGPRIKVSNIKGRMASDDAFVMSISKPRKF